MPSEECRKRMEGKVKGAPKLERQDAFLAKALEAEYPKEAEG